ncbi:uncharacterized protein LOC105395488 [Plutella xylostella]|uniref:uncharacterized protein LOC105395488 n=1 Tax=Plutella xylostella TaxID=51655 RepID=UPI0020327C9B|nr:uncharacterized protein LOC105395488 [Plutella xylostella]
MRTDTVTSRTMPEPPRSTAYYYGELERNKHRTLPENVTQLSEYVDANEIVNDVPITDVPPLRDRPRQYSLPEYSTPEGNRKLPGETYSTAGTFPMPEPKEKEPLLAELEVVGRLPLSQLEATGVRRSRSWYLCCPNAGDEEASRQSSWRYSSLRPVTQPPQPDPATMHFMLSSPRPQDSVSALKAERAALARSLAAERQRAQAQARAHDARLAELHGVIAELMRRRAQDQSNAGIPEELHGVIAELVRRRAQDQSNAGIPEEASDRSDECESTTQPAGELDNDADQSRTDQNDTLSRLSSELASPAEPLTEDVGKADQEIQVRISQACETETDCESHREGARQLYEKSLNLSERDSEICLSTARCCQYSRRAHSAVPSSCEREQGSDDVQVVGQGRCESRQAKLASRVRLKRTEDTATSIVGHDEPWCVAAEQLAEEVCAQADLREALAAAETDPSVLVAQLETLRCRLSRLQADAGVLRCAGAAAAHRASRLSQACAAHESASVALCGALLAADRALETYDVLLALAESEPGTAERESAELVARQLLAKLRAEPCGAVGEPLLSPGPWLLHRHQVHPLEPWTAESERALRQHAARLKSDSAAIRATAPAPAMFTLHEDDEEVPASAPPVSMVDMEHAVMMQEVLVAREERAAALEALSLERARVNTLVRQATPVHRRREPRDREEKHWLDASETDL